MLRSSKFLFKDEPVLDKDVYIAKGSDLVKTKEALIEGGKILFDGLKENKAEEKIEEELMSLAERLEVKVNGVFQPIRVALTNSQVSLPLFDSIRLLGIPESERRLERAINLFKEN